MRGAASCLRATSSLLFCPVAPHGQARQPTKPHSGPGACVCAHAEEVVVQRQLQELVGGDRALMQGCFLVDQLVRGPCMPARCCALA